MVIELRKEDLREISGKISLPYRWAASKALSLFFKGLKEKKILGSKCLKCGRVLVPYVPSVPGALSTPFPIMSCR